MRPAFAVPVGCHPAFAVPVVDQQVRDLDPVLVMFVGPVDVAPNFLADVDPGLGDCDHPFVEVVQFGPVHRLRFREGRLGDSSACCLNSAVEHCCWADSAVEMLRYVVADCHPFRRADEQHPRLEE